MLNRIRKNKRDIYAAGSLLLMLAAVVLILTRGEYAWGSVLDWEGQHSVFPEYFRQLFYETKNPFPSFAAEIGAGQNIYNFSYYGLFNPLYLPAYLLPFVSMTAYIQAVSIISVALSVLLFYYWIRKRHGILISFITSSLFLFCAPLIFQSHRHVMFVNYIPFLMLALICCDSFFEKRNRKGLIFSLFLIMMTSYYFSIGSYLTVFLYITALYLRKRNAKELKPSFKDYFKSLLNLAGCMLVSVMMSAVLWIPTLMSIISGRAETHETAAQLKDILIPAADYSAILYDSYSMGLLAVSLFAVFYWIFSDKSENRFLSVSLLCLMVFGVLVFVMNGFMYGEYKALIPLVPLALLLTSDFIKRIFSRKIKLKYWGLLNLAAFVLLAVFRSLEAGLALCFIADAALLNIVFFIYYKTLRKAVFSAVTVAAAFSACIAVNLQDSLVKSEDLTRLGQDYAKRIESVDMSGENLSRCVNMLDRSNTVNKVYGSDYYQTTVYSSLQNQIYNNFYYEVFENEVSHRNSAMATEVCNPLFYIYMGKKYLISGGDEAPYGYVKAENGLYKNENVIPIGSASDRKMSLRQFKTLEYPYTMKALLDYTVVDEDIPDVSVGGVTRIDISKDIMGSLPDGYYYDEKTDVLEISTDVTVKNPSFFSNKRKALKKDKINVKLSEALDGYLVIACDADNDFGEISSDVYLSINGVLNKLTDPEWKYYNNNTRFTYVIAQESPITELELVFSKGRFSLSDWEFYLIDKDSVSGMAENCDEFIFDKDKTFGDVISGTIDVTGDNSVFKMTVPYSDDFEITVDGKSRDYYMADEGFIAFDIPKGRHDIQIVYRSKGLDIALAVSGAGAVCFAAIALYEILTGKRGKNETGFS